MIKGLKSLKNVEISDIIKVFILKMFPKLKLDVKFKNKKSVKVNLSEFRSICGIIEHGFNILDVFDDGIVFQFYGYKLLVPFSKLKWMPGVLHKASPYWKLSNLEGKVVLDVGKFIGETAIFFLSKGAKKVIVVEPVKENVDILLKNLQINGFLNNVIIIEEGLSNYDGYLEVSYNNFGADFGREIGSNKIKIKVRNINYFLSFKPDIAKFNCEGCEKSILCANVDYIKAINEWFIQTHEEGLEKEIKHLMLKLGFTLIEEYRHQTKSCIWTLHFKWI